MSRYLSSVAVDVFDSEVKHAYQQGGYLRNTVTNRTGVVGDLYKFRKMGAGVASARMGTSSLVTPMDISHSFANATLSDYEAPEYTDIFNQATVNFEEKVELAKTIANALGRREDQLIIDALEAVTYSTTPSSTQGFQIAAGGTQLTVAKLRAAKAKLMGRGVKNEKLTLIHSSEDLENLLGETAIGSSDYNNVKALVNGEVNTFMGFNFVLIEDRTEGGLPANKAFAYAESAIGLATGMERKVEVNYIPERLSWLTVGFMKAGCVARDAVGTVEINMA